jgi:hypothetical protein
MRQTTVTWSRGAAAVRAGTRAMRDCGQTRSARGRRSRTFRDHFLSKHVRVRIVVAVKCLARGLPQENGDSSTL